MSLSPIYHTFRIRSRLNLQTQRSQLEQSSNILSKSANQFFKSLQDKRKSKKQSHQPQFSILLKKKETIVERNRVKNKTILNMSQGLNHKRENWGSADLFRKHITNPRTKEQIEQKYQMLATSSKGMKQNKRRKYFKKEDLDEKISKLQEPTSQMMAKLLIKNRIYPQRCLTGQNIMKLQENSQYTRFKLHELYSSYLTLLSYSQNSFLKFLKGFQMIMNTHKITIRSQIIAEQWQAKGNKVNFQNYLLVFRKMEQLIYKQTITDYIEVILEVCPSQNISYDDILNIYIRRYDDKFEAQQQTQYLWTKLGKQKKQRVSKKQIYDLCFTDQNFSAQMYRLYAKQIRPNQKNFSNLD